MTPFNPILYGKTGVYRGVHYFFWFLLKNIDCGYSLEPPHRGGSNEFPHSVFWAEIWKISDFFFFFFFCKNFHFLVVKFSIYLNRHVFVMTITEQSLQMTSRGKANKLRKIAHTPKSSNKTHAGKQQQDKTWRKQNKTKKKKKKRS